jgi:hypothetical protein
MSTAPQRERSDTPEKGLREYMLEFHKHCAHHEKSTLNMSKTILPRFRALVYRSKSIAHAANNEPEASEVPHLPHGIIIMSKPKMTTKTKLSTLSQHCPSSPKKSLPHKMILKDNSHFEPPR